MVPIIKIALPSNRHPPSFPPHLAKAALVSFYHHTAIFPSLPPMRYYYLDPFHQTAGPVEATALYEAYAAGTLPGGTLLAMEGTDTWRPIEDQLPYFYSYSGDARGPLTLRQIQAFSVNSPEPILVAMPGGGEWFPLARLPIFPTPPPHQAAALVPPPLPTNHHAPPAARRARQIPPARRTPVPVANHPGPSHRR
jgi:hypothetical protein